MNTKTILITGASTGIGRATALYFQQQGWNVIATMRSPEKERELKELEGVLVTRLDVTASASIAEAVSAGLDRFGRIDALVNNAGYGAFGPLEAFSMEKIRRQFDTNVLGLLEVTKAVLPHMRKQQSGVIVNISSVGGRITFPTGSLYHGTKFAVEGISEALQYELEPCGIRVKVVEPGAIKTDFAGRSFDFVNDESIAEYQPVISAVMDVFGNAAAQGAEPVEVAEVIWQTMTDESSTLRYPAAGGAEQFLAMRDHDDPAYFQAMKQAAGLAS